MQHSVGSTHPLAVPPEVMRQLEIPWRDLLPIWRPVAMGAAIFALLGLLLGLRLNAVQLHKDIDHHLRMQQHAQMVNNRLRLEYDSRGRAAAMEHAAEAMGFVAAPMVAISLER